MPDNVKDYKELYTWQQSMKLTAAVYTFCKGLPQSEKFGIISQMQRSAVSIPSNIAEGNSRHTRKDYVHFLYVARGSAAELETQTLLCEELFKHPKSKDLLVKIEEVRKLIAILISSLQ